jgi:putative sterol carrier protein
LPVALACAARGLAHNRNRRVAHTANKEQIMGVQEIADTMKSRVEASGFDRSVKFDTGSDGVIVIDGATISTTDAPTDCTI